MPTANRAIEQAVIPLGLFALASDPQGNGEGRGREYGVTFIKAGYVRRRDGKPAPWRIPAETLRAAVSLLDSRAVFIDHAGWFDNPSLRNLAGVTFDPEWNQATESIDGRLRLHDTEAGNLAGALLDQVLADQMAGRPVPDVGLSLVFYGRHDMIDVGKEPGEDYERVTTEIVHVESCDLVFGPGAEGRIKSALSAVALTPAALTPATLTPDPSPRGRGEGERSPERSLNNVNSAGSSPETAELPAEQKEIERRDRDREGKGSLSPVSISSLLTTFGGVTMDPEEVQTEQQNSVVSAPAAPPVQPAPAGGDTLLSALASLQQQVAHLTAALGRQEEPTVVQGMGQPPRVQGMQSGIERFAPTIDWLFGVQGAPYPDPQFRRADMIYQALTGDWEWRGVFNPDRVMLAGVNTTDLPNLAVNAMNKVILLQWASLRAYRWYELVSAVVPNDGSTHDMTWVGTGGIEVLPVVAEKAVYTELSLADTKETDAFAKYGGYVGITMEMFRRSEIAKIQAVPLGLARSAVMKRSANIAELFTANAGVGPTLDQDSKALFHTDHSNIATTAFGTDATAWSAADLSIWNHAELGSAKPLAISPKYMLCNRALFRAALVVFGYGDGQPTTYVPEAMDRGADDPRPWPIAVPDFSDANDWAAIVDPKLYPVIMMSYAQGGQGGTHPMPELYAVTSETQGLVFTNDTLPVKVRDWYAYGVNGYRGIAKRNVT